MNQLIEYITKERKKINDFYASEEKTLVDVCLSLF